MLESVIDEQWAEAFSEIWVYTGPIFEGEEQELELDVVRYARGDSVRVPNACYMIIADIDDSSGEVRTISVIMPQRRINEEPLRNFVTTVDAIEEKTGIDFLSKLPDAIESKVESELPDAKWQPDQVLKPTCSGNARPIRTRTTR